MTELGDAFLARARESLAGAESELANGRYNNAANRSYYACFQAAITALDAAGIYPTQGKAEWSHTFVQSAFAGQLVNRRKVYPPALRNVLRETQDWREQADYEQFGMNRTEAVRCFRRASEFVVAIVARLGETS